jgi:hypothetical protein
VRAWQTEPTARVSRVVSEWRFGGDSSALWGSLAAFATRLVEPLIALGLSVHSALTGVERARSLSEA